MNTINLTKRIILLVCFIILSSLQECQLPQIYRSRISHDLQPFEDGISAQVLEKAKSLKQICIYTIKKGTLYKNKLCRMPFYMECQQNDLQLPDMEFVVNQIDEPRVLKHFCNKTQVHWTDDCYCDEGYVKPPHGLFEHPTCWEPSLQLVPIFSPTYLDQCFRDILIPSYFHFMEEEAVAPRIPWNKRQFKAFWRGSLTGGWNQDYYSFKRYHRHKLIQLCRNISDCDAMFAFYNHGRPSDLLAEKFYGLAQPIRMIFQVQYKVIIDIDGHSYSSRFTVLLKMGVAVLKMYAFGDIGTLATKPWEHYIPANLSLSDLEQKIQWAKSHDSEVESIAKKGKQLADKMFTSSIYDCYIRTLLSKYYKLLIKGGAIS